MILPMLFALTFTSEAVIQPEDLEGTRWICQESSLFESTITRLTFLEGGHVEILYRGIVSKDKAEVANYELEDGILTIRPRQGREFSLRGFVDRDAMTLKGKRGGWRDGVGYDDFPITLHCRRVGRGDVGRPRAWPGSSNRSGASPSIPAP
jgi:hypothetical protein